MVSVQIAALVAALAAGGETALLDFHAPWCAPCRSMDGTIRELEQAGYPVRRVDVDRERHLASQFQVQNIPCFVLVVDGREVGRVTGAVSRRELETMFARAGVSRGGAAQATASRSRADGPLARLSLAGRGGLLGRGRSDGNLGPLPPRGIETSGRGPAVAPQDLVAASVRLKIADDKGFSYGSGTIIDARSDEALILTCGHIFRDSGGKGQILVDLCAPGGPQKLPGRLVSYDLKNDVGLVSVRPGMPVRVAPLAPLGYQPRQGDRVITVGCNNGGEATVEDTKVTAINKFLGPANLQVAGLPVQGRSGGGLFTSDGLVIGVCNAADPTDNEGLYAALAVVQQELDKVGLAALYQNRPQTPPAQALAGANPAAANPMAGANPMAAMGQLPHPAAATGAAAEQMMPAAMGAAADPAAIAKLQQLGQSAEVICIVRPLSDPRAKSEVVVLDRASAAFLQQLAVDREAQQAKHLTSHREQQEPVVRTRR